MLVLVAAAALAATPVRDATPVWIRSVSPAGWSRMDSGPDSVSFTRPEGLGTRSHPAAWIRVEYRTAQAPFGYLSSSVLAHLDCKARTYSLSDYSFFPGRNLSGQPSSIPDSEVPAGIVPGSRLATIYAALCPPDPTASADAR